MSSRSCGDGGAQPLLEASRLDERSVLAAQLVEQRVYGVFAAQTAASSWLPAQCTSPVLGALGP